jgi:post-segregation antitoxin (ccd killing protein)
MRMTMYFTDPSGGSSQSLPGRSPNVSVDEQIVGHAKAMRSNLSQMFEDTLRKRVQQAREAKRRKNKPPQPHNRLLKRAGVFGAQFQNLG